MQHWKTFYVYILTNQLKTVLYVGMTNNLEQRIIEHFQQRGQKTSFTGKYNVYFLLWFETHQYVNNAIAREKEIKAWSRKKKMKLIAEMNPSLKFLNEEIFGKWPPDELPERKYALFLPWKFLKLQRIDPSCLGMTRQECLRYATLK